MEMKSDFYGRCESERRNDPSENDGLHIFLFLQEEIQQEDLQKAELSYY